MQEFYSTEHFKSIPMLRNLGFLLLIVIKEFIKIKELINLVVIKRSSLNVLVFFLILSLSPLV